MTGRRGRSCPAGRLDQAATGRAQADLALETRVGSRVWITRTQGLIDRMKRRKRLLSAPSEGRIIHPCGAYRLRGREGRVSLRAVRYECFRQCAGLQGRPGVSRSGETFLLLNLVAQVDRGARRWECQCARPCWMRAASVQLPLVPDARVSGPRWRGRSGARGWCSTTGCAPGSRHAQAGLPYITDAELSSAVITAAKADPERAVAGGGVRGGAAAGAGRPERGLPELLRLAEGRAQGPKVAAAPVPVPQGQPAGDPVHRQRPVQGACRTGGCGCRRSATLRCGWSRPLPAEPSSA